MVHVAKGFKEGDRVVTIGVVPGFHIFGNYFATKIYEAKSRKRDKAIVWKLVFKGDEFACGNKVFRGDFPSPLAVRASRAFAKTQGLPFVLDVKENKLVSETKCPRMRKPPEKPRVKRPSRGDRFERLLTED